MKYTETALNKAVFIIIGYLANNSKVVNYQPANTLKEKLDLTLPDEGVALEELLSIM